MSGDTIMNENEALIGVLEKYLRVEQIDTGAARDSGPIVAVPEGMKLQTLKPLLDEYLDRPERRKGTAEHITDASLIAHVNRFKTEASAVFASYGKGRQAELTAVLNYHPKDREDPPVGPVTTDWCDHRSHYRFPFSVEWGNWTGQNGSMSQEAFAEFIEEHIADVTDPQTTGDTVKDYSKQIEVQLASPAKLMALSRGLSVRVESEVTQAVNLSSGEGQITFSEGHGDEEGKPISVPGAFAIAIPVFHGGPAYHLPVRLRYRVKSKKISWQIKVARADIVFDDAFAEVCDRVVAGTDLPMFFGTPER